MKLLVTGSAGFIGFHIIKNLLNKKFIVFGVDNLNKYYDRNLKLKRLKLLKKYKKFYFNKLDISNINALKKVFKKYKPDYVIHLAAQAGVRYSLKNL